MNSDLFMIYEFFFSILRFIEGQETLKVIPKKKYTLNKIVSMEN